MTPIARTPTPIPAPRPADFPAWECEAEGADVDFGVEELVDVTSKLRVGFKFEFWFTMDDVDRNKVLDVELDAPTFAGR